MKADDSFRIGEVPGVIFDLIDTVKSGKASALINVHVQSNKFLTKDFQIIQLKKEITETNEKINTIAWGNEFRRDLTANEGKDEFFKWGITQTEFSQYVDYYLGLEDLQLLKDRYFSGEDADQEITLPKFQLITDFLALLEYFNYLNEKLTALERVEAPEQPTDGRPKKGENMNLDLLEKLINLKYKSGAKPNQWERLSNDIKELVPYYNAKQLTALAGVIFQSGVLHKNTKPKTFSKWLKQFCDIIDFPLPTYKPNAITKEISEIEKTFYYLFP